VSDLVEQLLADWNYYRLQTASYHNNVVVKGFRLKPKKMTPEIHRLLTEMVRWCREHQLEPRLWIFGLFKIRQWAWPPKWEPGHLMSDDAIPKVRKLKGLGFFSRRRRATAYQQADEDAFDPNRDIDPTIERVKLAFYQKGDHEACRRSIMEKTLGFHPRSSVCGSCPVRAQCWIDLQGFLRFDVLALRTGAMTSREAESIMQGGQE